MSEAMLTAMCSADSLTEVARKMRITRGRLHPAVAEQPADDRQPSPRARAREAKVCRKSCRRTSSSPASLRTTCHDAFSVRRRVPRTRPGNTQGLPGRRGNAVRTCFAAGESGTDHAPAPTGNVAPARGGTSG